MEKLRATANLQFVFKHTTDRKSDSNSLFELPVVGKLFTWFKSNGSAKSRLDRVLVSEEWMESWPMCKQYV